jgi:SAM-dependent methyltransferase
MSESTTLKKLNVGCGLHPIKGFVNLDITPHEGVDVVFDLESCSYDRLPFADDTFDRILCSHVAEHINSFLPMMQELHRVARPGCSAVFMTPYGGNDIAFEDPTHVRQFFAKSWLYAAQTAYGGADYGYRGDWDCKTLIFDYHRALVPDGAEEQQIFDIISRIRNVCEKLTAELVAVKPARAPGQGEWNPTIQLVGK